MAPFYDLETSKAEVSTGVKVADSYFLPLSEVEAYREAFGVDAESDLAGQEPKMQTVLRGSCGEEQTSYEMAYVIYCDSSAPRKLRFLRPYGKRCHSSMEIASTSTPGAAGHLAPAEDSFAKREPDEPEAIAPEVTRAAT